MRPPPLTNNLNEPNNASLSALSDHTLNMQRLSASDADLVFSGKLTASFDAKRELPFIISMSQSPGKDLIELRHSNREKSEALPTAISIRQGDGIQFKVGQKWTKLYQGKALEDSLIKAYTGLDSVKENIIKATSGKQRANDVSITAFKKMSPSEKKAQLEAQGFEVKPGKGKTFLITKSVKDSGLSMTWSFNWEDLSMNLIESVDKNGRRMKRERDGFALHHPSDKEKKGISLSQIQLKRGAKP